MAPWSEPCKYMSKVLDGNPAGRGLAYDLRGYADFYALDITKFRVLYIYAHEFIIIFERIGRI